MFNRDRSDASLGVQIEQRVLIQISSLHDGDILELDVQGVGVRKVVSGDGVTLSHRVGLSRSRSPLPADRPYTKGIDGGECHYRSLRILPRIGRTSRRRPVHLGGRPAHSRAG